MKNESLNATSKEVKKNSFRIRPLVVTAILSAVSFILQLLEFSVPLVPEFLKFDFSDLPALLCAFALGPQWGVAVCFIKNLFHLTVTGTMGIGELSNFILAAVFTAAAGAIYMRAKTRKGAIAASLGGSVLCAVFSLASNYFLIYPLYMKVLLPKETLLAMYEEILPLNGNLFACLAVFNLPFTLIKCLLVSLIVFFIYKPLSPVLKGKG